MKISREVTFWVTAVGIPLVILVGILLSVYLTLP